jgi:hypothetical protein
MRGACFMLARPNLKQSCIWRRRVPRTGGLSTPITETSRPVVAQEANRRCWECVEVFWYAEMHLIAESVS